MGRFQPTYIGVIIHLLSTMDIQVGSNLELSTGFDQRILGSSEKEKIGKTWKTSGFFAVFCECLGNSIGIFKDYIGDVKL